MKLTVGPDAEVMVVAPRSTPLGPPLLEQWQRKKLRIADKLVTDPMIDFIWPEVWSMSGGAHAAALEEIRTAPLINEDENGQQRLAFEESGITELPEIEVLEDEDEGKKILEKKIQIADDLLALERDPHFEIELHFAIYESGTALSEAIRAVDLHRKGLTVLAQRMRARANAPGKPAGRPPDDARARSVIELAYRAWIKEYGQAPRTGAKHPFTLWCPEIGYFISEDIKITRDMIRAAVKYFRRVKCDQSAPN